MAVQVPKSKPLTIKPSYGYPAEKMANVTRLVKDKAVVIFSKSSCCICFGANPTVYELDERPDGQQIEKELIALGCKPSVPDVFIGQELVGGSNEIMSLHLKESWSQCSLKRELYGYSTNAIAIFRSFS